MKRYEQNSANISVRLVIQTWGEIEYLGGLIMEYHVLIDQK